MGRPLRKAIALLGVDTARLSAFDEPPFILRGVNISLADTCYIRLYVPRTFILDNMLRISGERMPRYRYILNKKVIGVTWNKPLQHKHRQLGFRIPYWRD